MLYTTCLLLTKRLKRLTKATATIILHLPFGQLGRTVRAVVAHALQRAAGVSVQHQGLVEDGHGEGLRPLDDVSVVAHGIPAVPGTEREGAGGTCAAVETIHHADGGVAWVETRH